MTKDKALKMAIAYLEGDIAWLNLHSHVLKTCKEALEQPAQEPLGAEFEKVLFDNLNAQEAQQEAELTSLLKEARKIIRASSSRNLAKDWDARTTKLLKGD